MSIRDELNLFIEKGEDFINSKYIIADIKIVNLLKSIASSNTLLALFRNCLTDFDYELAKKKYLVKSGFMAGDRGEFILPEKSKDLVAFVFSILMDIDSHVLVLSEFLNRFFYEDGSTYAGYSAFINQMIKPFVNTVKLLMESVLDGKLQDPIEALNEAEEKKAIEKANEEKQRKEDEELSKKTYGESLKKLRAILLQDAQKIKKSKLKPAEKERLTLIVNMLGSVIESTDKDAINYALAGYIYACKAHKVLFFKRIKKVENLLKDLLNAI